MRETDTQKDAYGNAERNGVTIMGCKVKSRLARFARAHLDATRVCRCFFRDEAAEDVFLGLRHANPGWIKRHLKEAWAYARRLKSVPRRREDLKRVPVPAGCTNPCADIEADGLDYWLRDASERPSEDGLVARLLSYDVVSFDVFDTLLVRKVDRPDDLFRVLGQQVGFFNFHEVRVEFERRCRQTAFARTGAREITLDDIYTALDAGLGFGKDVGQREVQLEQLLCTASPTMRRVFAAVRDAGKTVVVTSDMYLPRAVLEDLLRRNGYDGWSEIYLSSERGRQKGDGGLFDILAADFAGKRIVHVGDNERVDVARAREHGLDAAWWPDLRRTTRGLGVENDCLAASFYRSLICRTMVLPEDEESLLFRHGYRIGGILAWGYCQWLDELAAREGCDRILFSARDCEILYKLYTTHFGNHDARYLQISRQAIMQATGGTYYYHYVRRCVVRWARAHARTKPLSAIFSESGFSYLVPELEKHDIDPSIFPCTLREGQLEDFIYSCHAIVEAHDAKSREAAKAYFTEMLAGARKVLIVDIGWAGTSGHAFSEFVRVHMPEMDVEVVGALLCANKQEAPAGALEAGRLFVYAGDMQHGRDLLERVTPGACQRIEQIELCHMPLEYLFTSKEASLASYELDEGGNPVFVRMPHAPVNAAEIDEIQRGMIAFADDWREATCGLGFEPRVGAYTAAGPLVAALSQPAYCCAVYGRFVYDAGAVVGASSAGQPFVQFYPPEVQEQARLLLARVGQLVTGDSEAVPPKAGEGGLVAAGIGEGEAASDDISAPCAGTPSDAQVVSVGRVLLVSPEMAYTGALGSLLRMAKVLLAAGYAVEVWTARSGPFEEQFSAVGIDVSCVSFGRAGARETAKRAGAFDACICNTIATAPFVAALHRRLPLVWYIREGENLPFFLAGDPLRTRLLRRHAGVVCVSEYAAQAISPHARRPPRVVHNSVEDMAHAAGSHVPGTGEAVTFIQLGSIEQRKGYDVLLRAWQAMPEDYRRRSRLRFAGAPIQSSTAFCSWLFAEVDKTEGVEYLGLITDAVEKTRVVSEADVVVVASRDESCSLPALEACMLSRPLIVTENVGAKYMVEPENGLVVATGDVEALRDALMRMIDRRGQLAVMGAASRRFYDQKASMQSYARDIVQMVEDARADFHPVRDVLLHHAWGSASGAGASGGRVRLSEPQPISSAQTPAALSWPGVQAYETHAADGQGFYLLVKEGVTPTEEVLSSLAHGAVFCPGSIVCNRADLPLFRSDGSLRVHAGWFGDYRFIRDTPTHQLVPDASCGVLVPRSLLSDDVACAVLSACDPGPFTLALAACAAGCPIVLSLRYLQECPDVVRVVGTERVSDAAWDAQVAAALEALEARFPHEAPAILERLRGLTAAGVFAAAADFPLAPIPLSAGGGKSAGRKSAGRQSAGTCSEGREAESKAG